MAPLPGPFTNFQELRDYVIQRGFVRFYSGGETYSLSDDEKNGFDASQQHWVVVDRLVHKVYEDQDDPGLKRLHDSLSLAFEKGDQVMAILHVDKEEVTTFSRSNTCQGCGYTPPELTLSHFSFNSPHGACEKCHGLGYSVHFSPERVVNEDLTLEEGALLPWGSQGYHYALSQKFAEKRKIPRDVPYRNLSDKQKKEILSGEPVTKVNLAYVSGGKKKEYSTTYK